MSALLRGFLAQLRALAARRSTRLMLLLGLGASVLSVATYQRSAMRDLPVAVYDGDGTGLSRALVRALDATPELRVVSDPPATLDEAQAALVRGRLTAVVVIPDGFTAAVKRGRSAEVVVAADLSNVLTGKTAQRAVARVLATAAAGAQVSVVEKLGTPPAAALPRVVPITLTDAIPQNPGLGYAAYVAPAWSLFFAHVVILFLAWTVLWPPAPERPGAETLGRLLACFAVGLLVAVVATYAVPALDGLSPASAPPVVLALLAALVLADLLFAVAVCSFFRGGLLGFQATVLLGMLSLMLSGLTWPWDAIPPLLQLIAAVIPFTPFGRALRVAMSTPVGLVELARPLAWLGLQCLLYLAITGAAALVERRVARSRGRAGGAPPALEAQPASLEALR